MAGYNVFFKKSVWKDFESIPKNDMKKILTTVKSLSKDPGPIGCGKFSGQECYRLRLRVKDVEAAAVIVGLAMEEVVHAITMAGPPVQPERLISELAGMLSNYLFRDAPGRPGANSSVKGDPP